MKEKKKITLREAALAYKPKPEDAIAEQAAEEAFEVLSDGKEEIHEVKKINYDKTILQFSIKLPKALALKAGFDENSDIEIIVNPKEDTIKNIKSSIVIFKRGENGEGKKGA